MRDNSQGYLELRDAYERDGVYFGVVRIGTGSEAASIEFGVERAGYLALRRIFETRPFASMPGVKHKFYFNASHSAEGSPHDAINIGVRIEEGMNGRNFSFSCPLPLAKNLKWFFYLKDIQETAHLKRVPE